MLTPEQFVREWADPDSLCPVPPTTLADAQIPDEAKRFLAVAGLPEECAGLKFALDRDHPVTGIAKYYPHGQLSVDLAWYCYIGRSGAGDSICIDGRDGTVVYLDHDHRFARMLINSSVPQLAESLLAYARFYSEWGELICFGDDDDEEENTDRRLNEMRQQFEAELRRIDAPAVQNGTFWDGQLLLLDDELQGGP